MRRDWSKARAKVAYEGRCRVCSSSDRLEAAHTLGRSHDAEVVNAADVVPLCTECHRAYDARRLDLLPYLRLDEQAAAVAHVGILGSLRRLTGGAS